MKTSTGLEVRGQEEDTGEENETYKRDYVSASVHVDIRIRRNFVVMFEKCIILAINYFRMQRK